MAARIWQSTEGWKSWSGMILASTALHGLVLGSAWWWPVDAPRPRKVVTVEAICLTTGSGHAGGGAVKLQPAPQPPPKPQPVKEKPKPRVKPRPVPKIEEPPAPALAMPRPAAPARPGPSAAVAQGSGSGRGQGAGRGTGPGTGTGSGSGPGTAPGPGSGSSSVLKSYLTEVRRLLEKQKSYPSMARRQHREGVVVLRFTIRQGGDIAGHSVVRSSGHQVLDHAAADALQKVGRFPPLPAALGLAQLNIQVPLAFRLSEL